MQSYAGQRKLAGVFRFLSGKYLWDMTLLRAANELTTDFIARTKRETDGYLISLHESRAVRESLVRTGKPIVFLDDIDLKSISRNADASVLKTNQAAIGSAAASHFLKQADFASFGFVHAVGRPHWSLGRAEGFVRALARKRRSVIVYDGETASSGTNGLTSWIKSLPKPAAVFAAFDDRAVDVINACRSCAVRIPKDVGILGAGDDELVCNSCRPTVSSVRIPFEEHGFVAARELQAKMMLAIGGLKTLDASGDFAIAQRQSTSGTVSASTLVRDGLDFIAAHATRGIKVPDVVSHLRVSRRLADLRFRQFTGKSILQAIIETKIGEARRLLRTTALPISEVAERCGFANANYFKNVFVRTVGKSPRGWRNSQQA